MITIEATAPGRWTIRDTAQTSPLLESADTAQATQFIGSVLFARDWDAQAAATRMELEALAADWNARCRAMGNPIAS